MYLQKLELQGFKSFASKTILEFIKEGGKKKGITAIVGPNGSGKSNIADAIRWALGEQSLKLLRGKKSEDVIFLGSNKKSRLGFAEVSLYFNNEDRAIPIDYQEVVLTRRLYRNGESEYFINKNKVRLIDLILLASEANFGQKTYSIIGQGMADAILAASPSQRKEFFDEAAGVSQYQIKRNQAKNKLQSAEENLKQAKIMLEEIEPRLRSLNRQVKKLERREEIENKLRLLQEQYYGTIWQTINNKVKESNLKIFALEKEEKSAKEKVNSLRQELNMLEKEIPRSNSFRELQKEYERLFEEKNRLKEKEIILRNKIELKRHQKTPLSLLPTQEILNELQSLYQSHDSLLLRLENKKINLEEIKAEIKKLHQQFKNFLDKLNFGTKNKETPDQPFQKELKEISLEIEKINRSLIEVQAKIANLNEEEENKRKSFFELQRSLENYQNELNNITSKLNEHKIEQTKNQTRKEDLESEIRQELRNFDPAVLSNIKSEIEPDLILPEIKKLKYQLELIGGIDPEVKKEHKEIEERYNFLNTHYNDLSKTKESLEKMIEELDKTIKKQFSAAFNQINQEFAKYFKILFGGGKAELIILKDDETSAENEIKNSEENETCGIEIFANPPGKRLKNINMLSGGERALTSIALICAIVSNNPSPFIVLDEVDAALDESNSIKFANILDDLSCKTQFIIITHNRATMQKSNILYGITMTDEGTSKLLSVNLKEAEKTITNS